MKPVYHLGATLGPKVPFWDSRDDFGDTTLIVAKPEEGASLARALGPNWIVLMRRHGATVAGNTLEELIFRTIYTARNAAMQIQAHDLGHVSPLTAAETELAGEYNLRPGSGGARLRILVGAARQGGRQLGTGESKGAARAQSQQSEIQQSKIAQEEGMKPMTKRNPSDSLRRRARVRRRPYARARR